MTAEPIVTTLTEEEPGGHAAPARRSLMIVERDPAAREELARALGSYELLFVSDHDEALAEVQRGEPSVIAVDLTPPADAGQSESAGFQLLQDTLAIAPGAKVIALSSAVDREMAGRAVALGAFDICFKPVQAEVLSLSIDRAYRLLELEQAQPSTVTPLRASPLPGVLTRDPAMLEVARTLARAATSDVSILIRGESGTGKELAARAVHQLSARRSEPFVPVYCAAAPETVAEELFGAGRTRGAIGPEGTAAGGTLYLDEMSELPLELQGRLARWLHAQALAATASGRPATRVIAGTRHSLADAVAAKRFLPDLHAALAEISVEVPPLRMRAGDSTLLAGAFVRRFALERQRGAIRLSPGALDAIDAYGWPGNVLELRNAVLRAVVVARGLVVTPADLDVAAPSDDARQLTLRAARHRAEREAVSRALGRAEGNLSKAAQLLGISRPTLYDLLYRFGLK